MAANMVRYIYMFISAWGLRLLVLTGWAISGASKRRTSNGYRSYAFCIYAVLPPIY